MATNKRPLKRELASENDRLRRELMGATEEIILLRKQLGELAAGIAAAHELALRLDKIPRS